MSAEERIAKKLRDMPSSMRGLYERCVSGKASAKQCIKMQCLECWGWERQETMKCDNEACPLFRKRPFQKSRGTRKGAKSGNSSGVRVDKAATQAETQL